MRTQHILAASMLVAGTLLTALAIAGDSPSKDDFVFVTGGAFKNEKSNYYGKGVTISDFYIDKYEVSQKEWTEVMGSNPSRFKGQNLPVETVSWYGAIEYCNKRSIKDNLKPYYRIDRDHKDQNNRPDPRYGDLDTIKWTVTVNAGANGYRLPTEAEWEYAADGGQLSKDYTYSGSDDLEKVGWYWRNSGDQELSGPWLWTVIEQNHDQTKPISSKSPNELGLYDMSGNVREWCWDWYADSLPTNVANPQGSRSGSGRVWRGGGWMGAAYCTESSFRASLAANGTGPDQGFRVCRNK